MKNAISEARAIIEKLGQLSAHENIGACRADLIEAHRLLGDAIEARADLFTKANRVCALWGSEYICGNDDGGRAAHAMKQLQEALK